MKKVYLTIFMVLFGSFMVHAQAEFDLEPDQSMSITGKGPGQDATVNPYFGQDCYAFVENIGKRVFSVRIQKEGKILKEIEIKSGELVKILLLSDQELYFDSISERVAKATIEFKQKDEKDQ